MPWSCIVPVVVDADRQIDFGPIDAATRDIARQHRPRRARHLRDDAAGRHDAQPLRPDARRGQRADAGRGPAPRLQPRARAGRPHLPRPAPLPEGRRRDEPGEHAARGGLLPRRPRRGDRGARGRQRRGGRDDEAGRDDVPRRQHRLCQRARPLRRAQRDRRHRGDRARPTRSRTATSTSRASASAVTASRSIRTSCSTTTRSCVSRRWPARSTRGWAPSRCDAIEERIGSLDGQPVLVLGVAYRGDVREDAFSSAFRLRDELLAAGARVHGHDPYYDAEHLRGIGFEPYDLDAPDPGPGGRAAGGAPGLPGHGARRHSRARAVRGWPERDRPRADTSAQGSGMSASDAEAAVTAAGGRAGGRSRRVGRRPDLQRAREHRADRAGHPGRAAGGLAARSSTTPRRTGPASWPTRSPPASRASRCCTARPRRASASPTATRSDGSSSDPDARAVVQMDADFSHDPAALPRLLAPLMRDADLVLGTRYMRGRRHGRLAVAPQADQPRRDALRAHRAPAPVPRPDRRLQGLAARAARRDPAARDGGLGLRIPGGDDVVGASARRQDRPGPDRLPRARGGCVEDDRRHRARGAAARRCGFAWGPSARRSPERERVRVSPSSASMAPRLAQRPRGPQPSRRMTMSR